MRPRWNNAPEAITLVRHGESTGNQADERARRAGAERLDLDQRDADVELSGTGRDQADALRGWLGEADEGWQPTVVLTSPYQRAAETAHRATERLGIRPVPDERLRERDLGIFDGLTGTGIRRQYPDEAARRTKLGKFYYQPPSGESWADVVLRVRSLLDDLRHGYDGARVWMFTHQAVIMGFRYVLEDLSEEELLDIDRQVQIPNASLTRFLFKDDVFALDCFADTRAVDAEDAPVTHESSQAGAGHEQL
jgi:broad specificity phosphatase PhoE